MQVSASRKLIMTSFYHCLLQCRVVLALLVYLQRTFMFSILHNSVHDGTGIFHSTIIEIHNLLLLLSVLRV